MKEAKRIFGTSGSSTFPATERLAYFLPGGFLVELFDFPRASGVAWPSQNRKGSEMVDMD